MKENYLQEKRIKYDFKNVHHKHIVENIEYQDSLIERHIVKVNLPNNRNYEFFLKNYPFSPPIVYISDKNNTRELLSYCPSKFPRHIWYKIFEDRKECICCNNKMCKAYWSPAMNAMDIISEYDNFCNLVRDHINKRLLMEISPKLPDDIVGVIKEYLF
jgi:hypothetical protein